MSLCFTSNICRPRHLSRHVSFPTTRQFWPSAYARIQISNHYETLGLPTDASHGDIKKQFYALSKQNHPDLHPDDPSAPGRFHAISSAYSVLSDPSKRSAYDRETGIAQTAIQNGYVPRGSYSSAQARGAPHGARSPSGLSKRRAAFRGPPHSFYQSGGWGSNTEKRRAAQQTGTSTSSSESTSTGARSSGGFSPGQESHGKYWSADVPHFDRQAHFERQEEMDHRLIKRRRARSHQEKREGQSYDSEFPLRVIFVGSLVFLAWLPFVVR